MDNNTRKKINEQNSPDRIVRLTEYYPNKRMDGWMDGWLGFNGILSTQVVAISCLRKFK